MDDWLQARLDQYDHWLAKGRIDYSSKVIPVGQSLEATTWVLPGDQVMAILEQASFIALTHCVCRTHYHNCDHPTEVCLLLDDYGRKYAASGSAREIGLDEARRILAVADERGLVHLSLYRPDRELYALCSCCACCCHDLQLFLKYGRAYLVAHSDFVAVTDHEACLHCGDCQARCVFGARVMVGGRLVVETEKCLGCGLCVTTCPAGAVALKPA